jgi:hypothetical protein
MLVKHSASGQPSPVSNFQRFTISTPPHRIKPPAEAWRDKPRPNRSTDKGNVLLQSVAFKSMGSRVHLPLLACLPSFANITAYKLYDFGKVTVSHIDLSFGSIRI